MNKFKPDQHETGQYGDDIRLRPRLENLDKVEKYFIDQCNKKNIKFTFDCNADERSNWDTLAYTSYCGMLHIVPLCRDLNLYQLYDALLDNISPIGHIDFIKNNIENNTASKYVLKDNSEFEYSKEEKIKALCILPGNNKFGHLCARKIKTIANHWKNNLTFKLHPVCDKEVLKKNGFLHMVNKYGCNILDGNVDMYDLIKKANFVYSTHTSESALTSLILGKQIEPIDNYDKRTYHGFSGINHFCYNHKDAISKLDKIFASPKSGIIHPDIDIDWKGKIDKYLEYILEKRESQNGYYLK